MYTTTGEGGYQHPDSGNLDEGWPEPEPVVGRDAVMHFYADMRPSYEDTIEPIGEFIPSGGAVAVRFRWRASPPGQEVGMGLTGVYTLRDDRVSVIEVFRDHAEALEHRVGERPEVRPCEEELLLAAGLDLARRAKATARAARSAERARPCRERRWSALRLSDGADRPRGAGGRFYGLVRRGDWSRLEQPADDLVLPPDQGDHSNRGLEARE